MIQHCGPLYTSAELNAAFLASMSWDGKQFTVRLGDQKGTLPLAPLVGAGLTPLLEEAGKVIVEEFGLGEEAKPDIDSAIAVLAKEMHAKLGQGRRVMFDVGTPSFTQTEPKDE